VAAYETARQLTEKGHEVALLVMFDAVNPAFQQSVLKEALLKSLAKKMKFQAAELMGLKLKNAPTYVTEKVKELRRKIETTTLQIRYKARVRLNGGRLENSEQIMYVAVQAYRPARYLGRLVFFNAAERPSGDAWDASRGWSHLVTGEFVVHEVLGDHRSMFREPNVEDLANNMMNYFRRKGSGQEESG
jgi:thioesterase domain-containing protein